MTLIDKSGIFLYSPHPWGFGLLSQVQISLPSPTLVLSLPKGGGGFGGNVSLRGEDLEEVSSSRREDLENLEEVSSSSRENLEGISSSRAGDVLLL